MHKHVWPAAVVCAVLTVAASTLAAQSAPAAPALPAAQISDVEQLRIENIQLKINLLRQQFTDLNTQYTAVIQQIEREHPGYAWDPATNSLRAVPAPAKSTDHKTAAPQPAVKK